MSDFFISEQDAQQARIDADVTPRGRAENPSLFDLGATWESVGLGLGNLTGAISRGAELFANLPNTALETPTYLLPQGERARAATRELTDPNFGDQTDLTRYLAETRRGMEAYQSAQRLDAATLSGAQNVVSGIVEGLTPAILGGPAGFAAASGERTYTTMLDSGVDEDTAASAAIQDTMLMGLGAGLPASLQGKLIGRLLTGAALNAGVGFAQRGSTENLLRERGYDDLADQYRWNDPEAAAIDLALGAAFGGMFGGRHSAALRDSGAADAVLARQSQRQRENSAPGIPIDSAARRAHSQALRMAEAQAANDEPIDVSAARVEEQEFVSRDEREAVLDRLYDRADDVPHNPFPEQEVRLARPLPDGNSVRAEIAAADEVVKTSWGAELQARAGRDYILRDDGGDRWVVRGDLFDRTYEQAGEGRYRKRPDLAVGYWISPDERVINTLEGPVTAKPGDHVMIGAIGEMWPVRPERFAQRYQADTDIEAAVRQALEDNGFADRVSDLEAAQARARARGIDPEMFFSMGAARRGELPYRGNEAFHDPRLTDSERKAVEMARNNYANEEIADEMENSLVTVRVLLSKARKKIPGLVIQRGVQGPVGINSRTGNATVSMATIVRLRDKLRSQGLRNATGRPAPGRTNLNTVIAERLGLSRENVTTRLFQYDQAVREGRRAPLASINERGGFSTVADLTRTAELEFGASWDALSRAAFVEVVDSFDALPFITGRFKEAAAVHVAGKTYFNASRIAPEHLMALILHEVGVHHGLEAMVGKRGVTAINRQIARLLDERHPLVVAAANDAMQHSGFDYLNKEVPAYVVEHAQLARLIETGPELPLVQSFLAKVRQWLVRTFGSTFGMRLTIEDIRQLALASLRRVAKQAEREAGPMTVIDPSSVYASRRPDEPDAGSAVAPARRGRVALNQLRAGEGGYDAGRVEALGNRPDATPILVSRAEDGSLRIEDGNHRVLAARNRGDSNIEAVIIPRAEAERVINSGADIEEYARGLAQHPAVGSKGDFPLLSMGPGKNGDSRYTDPALSERFVNAVDQTRARLRADGLVTPGALGEESRLGAKRAGASGRGDEGGGRTAPEGQRSGRANQGEGARGIATREQVQALLQTSGIRIRAQPEGVGVFGDHVVTIDTPYDLEPGLARALGDKASGKAGTYLEFDLNRGGERPSITLRLSFVDEAIRFDAETGASNGIGGWLYRQVINWAFERGYAVKSDTFLSPHSQRVYESMRREGYQIIPNHTAEFDDAGWLQTHDGNKRAVFEVKPGEETVAPQAAPAPRGGYQIDGPPIKERMADVLELRRLEEERAAKSPEQQAEEDNPDMLFSYGANSVHARALAENAAAERRAAEDMRAGMEAAARCGARHAAQQVSRSLSAVTMNASARAGATIAAGHALGLTTAVPVGIFAAPMLAQGSAGYREADRLRRINSANQRISQHSRRARRAGQYAGAAAGLDMPLERVPMEGIPLNDAIYTHRTDMDGAQQISNEIPWQDNKADFTEDRANPPLDMGAPEPSLGMAEGIKPGGGLFEPASAKGEE